MVDWLIQFVIKILLNEKYFNSALATYMALCLWGIFIMLYLIKKDLDKTEKKDD